MRYLRALWISGAFILRCRLTVATRLIVKEAVMRKQNSAHITEKFFQAIEQGDIASARTLIQEGFDVNTKERFGKAALIYAVQKNNCEIIHVLIKYGASVDIQDPAGNTPLMIAVREGRNEAARILCDAGADLSLTNHAGKNALEIARNFGRPDLVKLITEDVPRARQQKHRNERLRRFRETAKRRYR
ncbi:MAG: ankyrin repeat domain-containing protein [Alphaproteobacteria bacterium]|nr:MAG: ankyrin repeat domain-containing protein [Alphaproteobacteria bacterium]